MRDASGDGAQAAQDQNEVNHALVSDLVSLIDCVQKCLRLIERTIAGEMSPDNPESSTNVIVLDDVSPRYMKAAAAVQACNVILGIALRSLLDSGDGDPHAASPPLSVIEA